MWVSVFADGSALCRLWDYKVGCPESAMHRWGLVQHRDWTNGGPPCIQIGYTYPTEDWKKGLPERLLMEIRPNPNRQFEQKADVLNFDGDGEELQVGIWSGILGNKLKVETEGLFKGACIMEKQDDEGHTPKPPQKTEYQKEIITCMAKVRRCDIPETPERGPSYFYQVFLEDDDDVYVLTFEHEDILYNTDQNLRVTIQANC